jgi:hypothetical protein
VKFDINLSPDASLESVIMLLNGLGLVFNGEIDSPRYQELAALPGVTLTPSKPNPPIDISKLLSEPA